MTRTNKTSFANLAAAHDIAFTLANLPALIRLAMTIPHDARPRIDSVRAWVGFDFSANTVDAQRIRSERA